MTFKTILVNLNDEARVPQLIAAAAQIASPSQAHVVGLYVMPPILIPSDNIMPMGTRFYDEQVDEHRAQAERIQAAFEELTRGKSFVAEWRVHGTAQDACRPIADGIVEEARAAELIIVSQAGPDAAPMLTKVPEHAAIESGRPVLVVPASWIPRDYGRDVAIAWNDSRESARAAFDALPLLAAAGRVRLLTVGEDRDSEGRNMIPSAEVAATLARRGLEVEIETVADAGLSAGDAILSRVAVDGADLLVMGAYGHSRLREFVLGGATRDVLKNMKVPVLFSH